MTETNRPLPIPAKELREKAFGLLCRYTREHPDEIAELTEYGYGAWLVTELSREAWRCAQSGMLMVMPNWRKTLTKEGPWVPPLEVYWGMWLPDDVANAYKREGRTIELPALRRVVNVARLNPCVARPTGVCRGAKTSRHALAGSERRHQL